MHLRCASEGFRGRGSGARAGVGNATHDAEIKQAKESGKPYADFRLGVRNRQGETNIFPVRCFGGLVEGTAGIKKGTKLFLEGELEISSFTGDEGEKRMAFRVLAQTYRILSGGRPKGEAEVPGAPKNDTGSEDNQPEQALD